MKTQSHIKLYPFEAFTDSKLTVVVENSDRDSLLVNVQGWRRILPNKTAMNIQNREGISYQCTPLDQNCCIQVRMIIKVGGKMMQHSVLSQPIKLAKELRQRMLYVIQPVGCRVAIDQLNCFMSIQVQNKKIRFLGQFSKCEVPLIQNIVDIDPNQNCFRMNFQHHKNQFIRFFVQSLRWSPKIRSTFCFCLFNTKIQRDLVLSLISENLYAPTHHHQHFKPASSNLTPRNDKSLKNNGSSSSLTSNNKSKNKNKEKVKISERLNLKRSYTKLSSNKVQKQANNNQECLNIFEDDDFIDHNTSQKNDNSMNTPDTAMDLRGSFEEFQQKSFSKIQDDKVSNHSFRQVNVSKTEHNLEVQNKRLKEENMKLRKEMESMNQIVKEAGNYKKKYNTAVEQINRLQNERRAIITDKVKFQSSYHREVQEKQYLKKQIQSLKQLANGKGARH